MRMVVTVFALGLAGCAQVADNGSPASNMLNMATDIVQPGAREAYRAGLDDAKCQQYGFRPQTEPYANCRLELERIRSRGGMVSVRTQ